MKQLVFNNGVIDLPDEPGCYAIGTGCGTGKTEACKNIIMNHADEGIMYCVDTRAEAIKMYNWIKGKAQTIGIQEKDVLLLVSEQAKPKKEREFMAEMNMYCNNPHILTSKKIIILTHARFWKELINLFLIYNPTRPIPDFDGDFETLMKRDDLRRWIIFDETPQFIQPFSKIRKAALGVMTKYNDVSGEYELLPQNDVKRNYKVFLEGDIYNDPFLNDKNAVYRIKNNIIQNRICREYKTMLRYIKPEVPLFFKPTMLAMRGMKTQILIFEGVADILFNNNQYYQLLDINPKYNSPIQFQQIDFTLERNMNVANGKTEYEYSIDRLKDTLKQCISQGRKTLVTVWKDLQTEEQSRRTSTHEFLTRVKHDIESDSVLCRFVDNAIRFTYYGAADTKSTNDYKDYDNIVLWGKWSIPPTDTRFFNINFGSNITNYGHRLWYFIQLISRIGIRMHDPNRSFNVYYTSDFSTWFIDALDNYFNHGTLPTCVVNAVFDRLGEQMYKRNVNASQHNDVRTMCSLNETLKNAIVNEQMYAIDITLGQICNIIPKKEKRTRAYDALVTAFDKLGVKLNITK